MYVLNSVQSEYTTAPLRGCVLFPSESVSTSQQLIPPVALFLCDCLFLSKYTTLQGALPVIREWAEIPGGVYLIIILAELVSLLSITPRVSELQIVDVIRRTASADRDDMVNLASHWSVWWSFHVDRIAA